MRDSTEKAAQIDTWNVFSKQPISRIDFRGGSRYAALEGDDTDHGKGRIMEGTSSLKVERGGLTRKWLGSADLKRGD